MWDDFILSATPPLQPLLTIAIPTWNRAKFLALNLKQLQKELESVPASKVELIVCDNHSEDETQSIVKEALAGGLPLKYLRHEQNLGSDFNIAECFNQATGVYVLILGDDDLFIDGGLSALLRYLALGEYGLVSIRSYGYDIDFRKEHPGGRLKAKSYQQIGGFLAKIGALITLISSCVINKNLLSGLDAKAYCGGNLVQVHLALQAALKAKENLFIRDYLIACKRNNSGGYSFSTVFVRNLGLIFDGYRSAALSSRDIWRFEQNLLLSYYPYYLYRQRKAGVGDLGLVLKDFKDRFGHRILFYMAIQPILTWPKSLALPWGALIIVMGRVMNGDLRRAVFFLKSRFFRCFGADES